MSIRRHISILAALGIVMPVAFASVTPVAAQTVFTQQQIIQKLRHRPMQVAPRRQRMIVREAPRQRILRRRAPQPVFEEQPRVMRRAPQPGTARMRVPGPVDHTDRVAVRRAPQPQDFETQEFRAPPPQGGQVQKFRAPPASGGKPPVKRPNVEVASTQRGLDVRPADRQDIVGTNYPDSGRVDLEILFEYDSANIDPGSVKQLIVLGEALNDAELAGSRIVIAGHTDAAGSNGYNADLSLRRARAVYDFLVNYAGVEASRLVPEGYGESLLKFPDAPQSGQNRRVEIINLGDAG